MAIKCIFILQKVVHDYAKVKQWNSFKKIDSIIAGLLNRRKNKVEKKFPRNL